MTDIVDITSAYIKIGNFDSRRRYLRRDLAPSSSSIIIPTGRTLDISRAGGPGRAVVYRYSIAGYTVEQTNTFGPDSTFTAGYVAAKL